MTAPTDLVTESVETLAEALRAHQTVATGLGEWCCSCSPTEWRPIAHRSPHIAAALIASGVVRVAGEVRADAWDEGYRAAYNFERGEVYPEPRNPYRAALAEETPDA